MLQFHFILSLNYLFKMFVLKLTIQKQMSLNHISNSDSYSDLDQMTIIHSQMARSNLVKYVSVISGSPQNFYSKILELR